MTQAVVHWALSGFGLCMVLYAAYLLLHRVAFLQMLDHALPPLPARLPRVAVVIPARNEVNQLGTALRALLAQTYPRSHLQVVVVDDHSTDGTAALAESYAELDPQWLRVIRLEGNQSQKKAALDAGIRAAEAAELILTLDADCRPGPDWVRAMAAVFQPGTAMVAGPIRKVAPLGDWFEQLQALESAGMMALAAGAIGWERPMMANGGNLGFRRAAFLQVGGYSGIDHVASGDDELLMHKMHHAFRDLHRPAPPIAFALHPEAVVETDALIDASAFRAQRLRWVSKARAYHHPWMTLAQVNAYLAMLGIPLAGLAGLAHPAGWVWLAGLLAVKTAAEASLLLPALRFLGQTRLAWLLLPAQPLHVGYVLWVGAAGLLVRDYAWKGRRVR